MSYYEDRIKALEARIEEMAMLNRMKAVPVEAKLMDRIGELNAENARLKAEVEAQAKRWAESEDLISHYKEQRDEVINDCQCSRLKAEVEELTGLLKASTYYNTSDEVTRLKAEVERLRASSFVTAVPSHQYERIVKAGDAMAEDLLKEFGRKEMLKYQPYQDWNAAKNGWDDDNESKQP
jgi:uncharacterized coiled-coil DUF342 family protein